MADHPTRLRVFPDDISLGTALASTIADLAEVRLRAGGHFVLGCPGGRTPATTFAGLASEFTRRDLDLSGLIIAMMDDYVVADGDSWRAVDENVHNSCRRFAREEIQAVINRDITPEHRIPDANVWFPDPHDPESYDTRLTAAGGVDFFILASGAGDGHVAFNPPGSPVDSRTRVVELAQQTRRDNLATFPDFTGIDDVPTHGVTVGIGTIAQQSHAAALVLVGTDKQVAFDRLRDADSYDPTWPASVYTLIDNSHLYVESAAVRSSDRVEVP